VEDLDIFWNGTVVGRLMNTNCETIRLIGPFGGSMKVEGNFVRAEGAVAAEFQRRLDAHEALEVRTAHSDTRLLIYGRPDGRAKLAWCTEQPTWGETGPKTE
jgi:hypothetical protein